MSAVNHSLLRHRTRAVREAEEREHLSPLATRAADTRGRDRDEPEDAYRTAFERDRDRILHSKAFRRLKHKTQVFLNPDGDHYVTRLTHTLAVAQVGRAIAATLALNEALTEAICLGHDIGHAPFGHTGETALTPYVEGEWQHAIHGVRVVEVLEPLNLTWEVRDGIRQSSWKNDPPPATAEGLVCRFADRIAYLAHDAEDALRAGVITVQDIPADHRARFGEPGRDWIECMVDMVVSASVEAGEVTMRPDELAAMTALRRWMFDHVYLRPQAQRHSERAVRVIRDLVDWFAQRPDDIPESYRVPAVSDVQAAVDYVAGMSDKYAMTLHDTHFRPAGLY
ncbi:HD domain-containing protein [Egicoccus halophilus]|uniref:Deoxyguanosinetriphosphate triphosphohydrolase-like protein n=1 Tax=Egicoccus halophilus TaxID=1670830 RepID=A0A8J3A887_9ACTN|nr:HD domain-containing protein [Egicoccus halophilus]GGI06240.1 deoxyguanosinetriphosphate triphosphohydrolase-like protein [Egicoccus halophilus]